MNKKETQRGRKLDRAKVAGSQEYEVDYEKNKMKVTAGKIKEAVKSEGNSRKKIEKNLKK
jgi:hypothetical protein